jgi:hypothetical protein
MATTLNANGKPDNTSAHTFPDTLSTLEDLYVFAKKYKGHASAEYALLSFIRGECYHYANSSGTSCELCNEEL